MLHIRQRYNIKRKYKRKPCWKISKEFRQWRTQTPDLLLSGQAPYQLGQLARADKWQFEPALSVLYRHRGIQYKQNDATRFQSFNNHSFEWLLKDWKHIQIMICMLISQMQCNTIKKPRKHWKCKSCGNMLWNHCTSTYLSYCCLALSLCLPPLSRCLSLLSSDEFISKLSHLSFCCSQL